MRDFSWVLLSPCACRCFVENSAVFSTALNYLQTSSLVPLELIIRLGVLFGCALKSKHLWSRAINYCDVLDCRFQMTLFAPHAISHIYPSKKQETCKTCVYDTYHTAYAFARMIKNKGLLFVLVCIHHVTRREVWKRCVVATAWSTTAVHGSVQSMRHVFSAGLDPNHTSSDFLMGKQYVWWARWFL